LTIHSLPEPAQALSADAARTRTGRLKMLLVLLVCAAPVIASYFTYYVIRPDGRRNYGELIEPQRDLPASLQQLKGQWLLVSVGGGACDADCRQRLYFQRQLREGLGAEKGRLDWVWLIDDDKALPEALAGVQGATVLRVPREVVADWLVPAQGHALQDHLYVVDPMGHWMMRFPAPMTMETAPKALRDLTRLLRASSSWDRDGR
jgi:hypothetical protein